MPSTISRFLTILVAMILAGTGCTSSASHICEAMAACEGYSDTEREQCETQLDVQGEQADAMECADAWDAFLRCGEDAGECEDSDWSFGDSCATEEAAYLACMGVTPGDDDDDSASSGDDDDSANACGTIGQMCSDPSQCSGGETCYLGGSGGVCSSYRDGCGGFAGATCNDPAAPICLYLASADYGVCVSAVEKDCICTRSPNAIEPGYC